MKYQNETHSFVMCIDEYNSNKKKRYRDWDGVNRVYLSKDDVIVSVESAQKLVTFRSIPNSV